MLGTILKEIELQKNYLKGSSLESIYFGGGTPTVLDVEELSLIVKSIQDVYDLDSDCELTIEANPDDLNAEMLQGLYGIGFNRLSIGIQSFDNEILKSFNRAHDDKMAIECVGLAQKIGFDNISIDLIFGAPNQSVEQLNNDIDRALSLNTQHVSIYGLTIEEDTVFGKWEKLKKLSPLAEEVAAQHFETIMSRLGGEGFEQYEISNFAKSGYRSRHNSSYWRGKSYLGIGPSAHSYDGKSRQSNVRNNTKYIQSLEKGKISFTKEVLSDEEKTTEYIMIRLRTIEGIDLDFLRNKFGIDLVQKKMVCTLVEQGKIMIKNNHLRLTQAGKLIADYVTECLLFG